MATPVLEPGALKDVQVRDAVPTWDGDGVKAQDWVLSYARWEQDVGVVLGEEKLIKTLLGAIPKGVADPIDKRMIHRNLSSTQVKEGVLREVNPRVNRNLPNHVFHGLIVPKNCSAGELSNFCCGLFLGNSTCTPVPLCFSKSKIPNQQTSQDL